jgi:hypothetical protein
MLSVYTNQQDLLKSTNTIKVSRLESVDKELLDTRKFAITFKATGSINLNSTADLELHVYTPDGVYLTGNHDTQYSVNPNGPGSLTYQHLSVDTNTALSGLGINRGQYKVVYNLFNNLLGSYKGQKLWIKEISPSRRELRIQLSDNTSITLRDQLNSFRNRWNDLLTNDDVFDSFLLNFGFNETYQIINMRFDTFGPTPEIIVRLYAPLPAKYGEKARLWISEEIIDSLVNTVSIIPEYIPDPVTTLAGPNFELEQYDGGSVATNYKNWTDLLSSNIQTSQQLIDSQFPGSLSGVKLNTSYRIFDNFVHYGSAVERVKNFKYKMELIEYYNAQIQSISQINGGNITQTNLADNYIKRNRIVSGFDDFEKYLFFESTGSAIYSHVNEASGSLTSSSIQPWPKKAPTPLQWSEAFMRWNVAATQWSLGAAPDPYGYFATQESTTSATGNIYYLDLLDNATLYDRFNIHKLQNTIPIHIQNSDGGDEYSLFINMVGQHFDILWTYIKGLTTIHTREEHPKDGMPDDILYQVAQSLGFNLLNGKSTSELWKYSLGVDENGNVLQDNVNGISSISDEKNTKEIWRRIVNNLPYILKSKGTSRSVKALLACYGIPSTVLTIKEYGGPSTFTDNDHYPEYVHDKYHYAWLSQTGSLSLTAGQFLNGAKTNVYANTLEFRFKTDNNYTYGVGTPYNILSIKSGSIDNAYNLILNKETNDDNQGTITLFSGITGLAITASNLEIFDNSWISVVINNSNLTSSLNVVKSLYGNTIYNASASFSGTGSIALNPFSQSTIVFASGSRSITPVTVNGTTISSLGKFHGHFQEIRLWSGSLNNATIQEHAASPATYTYNVDRTLLTTGEESAKPFEHLLQRFTLSDKTIKSGSFYQSSTHPNQTINTGSIYFNGFGSDSGSIKFEGFEETYYTPSPSLGASSLYSNKVRIESSSLDVNKRLNTKTRIEKSSFDRYSLDSNRLGVYFSPQTAINEDIFNQLGYFEIDDYIGDPGDILNDNYTKLNNFAINYWKKYENRNDFEAYFRALQIYDFTLFKYIKQLLPKRVNAIVGLVVEPNVLERSKVKLLNKPVIENLKKDFSLSVVNAVTASGEYQDLNGLITQPVTVADSSIFPNITAVMSSSLAMTSEYQSYVGLIENNTTDIDKLGTSWVQNRYIAKYKLTESGSYNPIQTTIYDQRAFGPYSYTSSYTTISSSVALVERFADESTYIISTGSEQLFTMPATYTGSLYCTFRVLNFAGAPTTIDIIDFATGLPVASKAVTAIGTVQTGVFTLSDIKFKIFNRLISVGDIEIEGVSIYESVTSYSSSLNINSVTSSLGDKFQGTGYINARLNGSKLVGSAINVNSTQTIDGGPVVKVTKVNPNQIVFSNNQLTTIDRATSGRKTPLINVQNIRST